MSYCLSAFGGALELASPIDTAVAEEQLSRRQFAALPARTRKGKRKVLLVTSRETQRWIIPKGWPASGRSPRAVAAREAREEAGVIGRIGKRPIGTFQYEKCLAPEANVVCEVIVYLLKVDKQLNKWPEMACRERCWLTPAEAASRVAEGDLSTLLLKLDDLSRARR